MKFKKIINLCLVASMLLGALSGCSKKEIPTDEDNNVKEEAAELKPEEGAELSFWVLSGDAEFGKAVAGEFEAKYGVKVEVQEAGFDVVNKMMLDGPSGNGADVFVAPHDLFTTAKDSGVVAELSSNASKIVKDQVSEVAVKTVTDDGKIYGVPVSVETYALLYNKDLVKGVPTDGFPAYPYLSLNGFELFGPDGKDGDNPGFNTEEFKKGLENIAKLKEFIPIKADDLKMETMTLLEQNFKDGKTAYYPIGPWLIKSLKAENVNFGVTKLPTLDGKQMKSLSGVQSAYVSSYSKYPQAAELLATFLSSDEAAQLLYEKSYKITAKNDISNVKGLNDISNVKGLKEDKDLSVFTEQFKNSVPMPSTKRISYYWTIMQSVLNPVFDGKMTKKAQSDFEALVTSE